MTGVATVDVYGYRIDAADAALWQRAQLLAQRRDFDAAAAHLQRILASRPGFVPAMVQAAHFLRMGDRYRDAEELAIRAAMAVPEVPELAVETGKLLRRFERPRELLELFDRIDWSSSGSGFLLVEAARLLAESGLHEQALAMLDRAERAEPGYAHQYYMRGSLLAATGDMPAARMQLRRAIDLIPASPHAHWMLSVLPDDENGMSDDLDTIRTLLRQTRPGSEARAYLGYALHNRLHRLGQHREAWDALEQGMQARRMRLPYLRDQQEALFGALQALDLSALAAPSPAPAGSPALIFIIGMHRSGTSLLERILAGHSQVADGGETYAFAAQLRRATDHDCTQVVDYTVLSRIATADLTEVADGFRTYARWRAAGRPVLTEKLPSNFLLAGIIAHALPEARILHMRRDPVDTCFSNLRTFFGNAAVHSYDPLDVADYYLRYRRLMSHWHRVLPGRILDIDYSGFVADPEDGTRRVLEFCGLEFEPAALDIGRSGGTVATASIGTVRAGILKDRGGAWRPYATQLEAMIRVLAPAYIKDGGTVST